MIKAITLAIAAAAAAFVTAPRAEAQDRIIYGDWVAACVENYNGGSPSVYCDRFGGFLSNQFPPGCNGNAAFACQNMTLCQLATYVHVIDENDYYRLQSEVEQCDVPVLQPPTRG